MSKQINVAAVAQQDYLSRYEAAAYLRISVSKLDQLVKTGELSPRRLGRRVLFSREALGTGLARPQDGEQLAGG